jgi:putative DNA primase/helicase
MAALGLRLADLYDEPRAGQSPESVYTYVDEEGRTLFAVCRFPGKRFACRRLDPQHPEADDEGHVWGLDGVRRVPYRLTALLAGIRAGRAVYIAEGEKDVRALERAGEIATCNPGGAGRGKWRAEYAQHFAGADVVVIRDRDEEGRAHAERVAASLRPVAASVRVVEAALGKDASDHLDAGLGVGDLVPVEEGATSPSGRESALERGDLLIADRFVAEVGADYRYIPGLDWHRWTGAAWRPCDLGEHVEACKAVVRRALGDAGMDQRTAVAATGARRIAGALELAAVDPRIALAARALDADGFVLATPGGIVELRTGRLRPAERADLVTRLSACAPGEDEGPGWLAFLERVQPDPELRAFLQRLVGRSLVGREGPRVLPICHGEGANGKSTFVTAVRMVLGDYAHAAELGLLMGGRACGPSPEVVGLRGRRFVVVSESPEDGRLSVERVKALTGGDAITARGLYRNPVTFEPSHTIWLSTNHRPRVGDDGPAIWDRLLLVPWSERIPAAERVEGLGERLAAEDGPGILRWAVNGAADYLRDGLAVPECVRTATEDYRAREDSFGAWLAERTEENPAGVVRAGALMADYRTWAEPAGAPRLTDSALRERLEERGFERDVRSGRTSWIGLRLRDEGPS